MPNTVIEYAEYAASLLSGMLPAPVNKVVIL